MNNIRFITFSLFDHSYKKGHESPFPVFNILVVFQFFLILNFFILMDNLINTSIMSFLFKTGRLVSVVFGLLLYFLNYRYFITKKSSEKLIEQFQNDEINTRRNRMIARFKFFAVFVLVFTVFFLLVFLFRT